MALLRSKTDRAGRRILILFEPVVFDQRRFTDKGQSAALNDMAGPFIKLATGPDRQIRPEDRCAGGFPDAVRADKKGHRHKPASSPAEHGSVAPQDAPRPPFRNFG
jgi:hypothetical protein